MSRPHLTIALAIGVALALSACAPDPVPPATSAATGAATSTATAAPTPTATATAIPTAAALPASCDQLYSTDLAATLDSEIPPLNDAALADFLSTENVQGLDVLASGVPSLRCTWGAAGTPGLATTVARIDGSDADAIQQQLLETGFTCDDLEGGTICRYSQRVLDQDDNVRTNGETHWFGSGFWVATHWVDYDPEGYTRDIAGRLAV